VLFLAYNPHRPSTRMSPTIDKFAYNRSLKERAAIASLVVFGRS
jgi:hypothetical protein